MKLPDKLPSHYLIPNFNDEFLEDIQTPLYLELPYPISKPLTYAEEDVIDKIHEVSENYSNELQILSKEFQLVKDKIVNQSFKNSHACITEGLLNFCNTQKCEKPFLCDYNPYYTSGCLEYFTLNDGFYFIRPDSKNNLYVTNIGKLWKNKKIKLESSLDQTICGINSFNSSANVSFLLQSRTEINLMQIRDIRENAEIKWNKKFKKKVLSSKFNRKNVGILLADFKLKLYDIETKKRIKTQDVHLGVHLDFIDENSLLILNHNSLIVVDQRSQDYKKFQPELDECNILCSARVDGELIYIASRHHLIKTDIRYFKTVDFCSHLMANSPCYMELAQNGSNKFLCLSSQKHDEKVLFTGNSISGLPMGVPSVHDTLTKCKLNKDVLLIDQLDERLYKSTSGIKLLCDNNDVFLYSNNTLGDIFKQKITEEFDNDQSHPIDRLYYWINKLPEIPKPLHLTNIVNLSDARFALNKKICDENLNKFTKKNKRANFFLNHFNNVYHKNNLGNLASNFVSIWIEEEEDEREEVPDLVPSVPPLEKVHSWIESNYFLE